MITRVRARRPWMLAALGPIVALGVAVGAGTPAVAATSPAPTGVSVTPVPGDRFASKSGTHLELGFVRLGVPVRDKVRVLNVGSDSLTVDIYAADAIPALNGGFGFTAEHARTHDVGSWITMAATRLVLPGHSSTTVPFRLVVPTHGVAGGEHVGGIVAEPVSSSSGGGLQTKTRFAMGVYLTVPGPPPTQPVTPGGKPPTTVTVTKLSVHPHGRQVCPRIAYRNDTKYVIDPSARITVHSSLGLGSRHLTVDRIGALLPGAAATVTLPCVQDAPPGPDDVTVTLTSPHGVTTVHHDLFVTPWTLFIALLFLLLLLVLIALEMWRRKRARERELAELRARAAAADPPATS